MLKNRKILGTILASVGVFLARIEIFLPLEKTILFACLVIGIHLAFIGLAVYASGMQKVLTRLKACPFCLARNEVTAKTCKQCRKKLREKEL
jgi:hypothetical protein